MGKDIQKRTIFETMHVTKALVYMAVTTVLGQIVMFVYSIADTLYIGRTDDPYMSCYLTVIYRIKDESILSILRQYVRLRSSTLRSLYFVGTPACLQKGANKRTAMMLALFAEEMVSNAVEHGFSDKKPGYLDICYVYSPEKQVIRFRDNGKPFDPVDWLKRNQSEDKLSGAGIRIVVGLNNLMITMQS